MSGPCPCEFYSDLKCFNEYLSGKLEGIEKFVANKEYKNFYCISYFSSNIQIFEVHKQRRERHKTINTLLKSFNVLHYPFKHLTDLYLHFFTRRPRLQLY